jgi:basic membrane protein A
MNIIDGLLQRRQAIVLVALAGVVPLAGTAAATATTEPPAETVATEATTGGTAAAEPVNLDTNGDGTVVFGIATPGPRDDGGYYQAMVDGITQLSEENGFAEPIIVDNIDPASAETELRNLARQNVDVIAVGAGELSDPLPALTEEFSDIFWYCNCGAGIGDVPGLAQGIDDSTQISYSAGYATGLLLQDTDATSAAFLGCCDLDFERLALLAFQAGLQAVDDSFTATYIPTGDFNDVAGATEAYNQAVDDGAGAVYPFLGGSQEAVAGLANEDGIITMAPGPADACERDEPNYQIAVVFDGGVYMNAAVPAILAGELSEGESKLFLVGEFEPVGAYFCDATPEQEEALQAVRDQIAAGEFDELFNGIKAEVFGGAGAPATTG